MAVPESVLDRELNTSNENKRPKGRRLYTWSRPTREMRSRGESLYMKSEHSIKGAATIAFHASGDWFKGNIISNREDAYTIHGRRRKSSDSFDTGHASSPDNRTHEVGDKILPPGASGGNQQPPHRSTDGSTGSSFGVSPSQSIDETLSVCDSLDSELVTAAMERLDLELEGVTFNVDILDYETGINHTIKDVVCRADGENLTLDSDTLEFSSQSSHRGNMADIVISSNIGPSLVEKGLTVYRGELKMTYRDEPCFPVSVDASQWCL